MMFDIIFVLESPCEPPIKADASSICLEHSGLYLIFHPFPYICRTYGTISYMPAEVLTQGRITQATDVYSLGIMSE